MRSTEATRRHGRVFMGSMLALAAIATVAVELIAAAASRSPYSFARQAISDLGVTRCGPLNSYDPPIDVCSPAHAVVNVGCVATGIVIAVAVLALRGEVGRSVKGWVAAGLLALGGLMQAAVGLVPLDQDLAVHGIAGMVGFIAQNCGMLVAGLALHRRPPYAGAGVAAIALGAVGLVATALIVAPTAWGLPFGIVERVAVYPFLIWLIIFGVTAARRDAADAFTHRDRREEAGRAEGR